MIRFCPCCWQTLRLAAWVKTRSASPIPLKQLIGFLSKETTRWQGLNTGRQKSVKPDTAARNSPLHPWEIHVETSPGSTFPSLFLKLIGFLSKQTTRWQGLNTGRQKSGPPKYCGPWQSPSPMKNRPNHQGLHLLVFPGSYLRKWHDGKASTQAAKSEPAWGDNCTATIPNTAIRYKLPWHVLTIPCVQLLSLS